MRLIGGIIIAVVLMGIGFYVARLDYCTMGGVQIASNDASGAFGNLHKAMTLPVPKAKGG
jgi:hypothetical protein